MNTIKAFSGLVLDLDDPRPEMISADDISHALSQICRFGGHARRFYSVAEHSVLVADVVEAAGGDQIEQMIALTHDAHKAYLGDIPSPLKHALSDYPEMSLRVKGAIAAALNIPSPSLSTPRIAEAERFVGAFEDEQLMPDTRPQFSSHVEGISLPAAVTWRAGLSPHDAELLFCRRYDQLNVARRSGG